MLKFTENSWEEELETFGLKDSMDNLLFIILSFFYSKFEQEINIYFDCEEISKDIGDKIILDGLVYVIECSSEKGIKIKKENQP